MAGIKLYPPTIPEVLPAFYKDNYIDNDGTVTNIAVPFSMNKAVNTSEIWGFALKIKTIQSNKVLSNDNAEIKILDFSGILYCRLLDKFFIDNNIKIGQFLKVQLAYISKDENNEKGEIGYYSNVGIVKYTSKPNIYIKEFQENSNTIHNFSSTLTGIYELGEDITEKPYQYQFSLLDNDNEVCETSGWLMHDNINESNDIYTFNFTIEPNSIYKIKYEVKTINNLKESSIIYRCKERIQEKEIMPFGLEVKNIFDEGYINISFNNINQTSLSLYELLNKLKDIYNFSYSGSVGETDDSPPDYYLLYNNDEPPFIILKIIDSNNDIYSIEYQGIEEEIALNFELHRIDVLSNQDILIKTFSITSYNEVLTKNFKDFTIEQGKIYQYYFRQKNSDNTYSQNFYSKSIIADFEDMFLWDGQKQLKIRFNPKISSFKVNLLEQKVDTIGSQYPFIFKNGKVKYAEFPISGLISYHIDENKLFFENKYNKFIKLIQDLLYEFNSLVDNHIEEGVFYISYFQKLMAGSEDKYKKFKEIFSLKFYKELSNKYLNLIRIIYNDQNQLRIASDKYMKDIKASINTNEYFNDTNLTGDNIYSERDFKTQVLEWLNNGELKLFKSPTEGNYLIRLMNISLSPEDKLNRMLHTFSGMAYECEDCSFQNLLKYNFLSIEEESGD